MNRIQGFAGLLGLFLASQGFGQANPLRLTPHHATISVANLDVETKWYADVLGFERTNAYDNAETKGCWMNIPGYRIDLIQQKDSSRDDKRVGLARQGWLHVVFQTPIIEEALKRLQAAGTDVKVFKYPDGRIQRLVVHDPESNEVELHS